MVMETNMTDYRIPDIDLLGDPCDCQVCRTGQVLLRMTLAYNMEPLPLPEYQCVESGGLLRVDPATITLLGPNESED